ncbi:acyltransferase family protein [Blastococcus tunisiensis]|uniref:Peptidoglycan/LPS O-acetylase OafA/YrhL, contains acyltransferase and SGNH-hydrolase domains n=1 Tax=Blastococcus tunisiensis TaxID=1798228 RepID=A0A1I2K4X1_9ACTN|nr:acyltransferase [Blastococcus sp. DSM 46838]SFF61388.1 Peptidoglycan/LPS O-acetylase OafA/YrhL, contains acyltransferase and SGNH-hydrolase domains [Blastococcus sp. DSM 46838]
MAVTTRPSASRSPAPGKAGQGYVPALDGLRGIAVLLVLGLHIGLAVLPGGQVGVFLFFSLSGFLITLLLLDGSHGNVWEILRRFYVRRALRLLPAWFVVVASCVVVALMWPSMDRAPATLEGLPMVLVHLGNWVRALEGSGSLGMLDHTWSLAVEEQFYLVWPIVLLLVLRATGRIWAAAAVAGLGCISAVAARFAVDGDGEAALTRIYNGTDTQADHLLLGCVLAVVVVLLRERDGLDRLRTVLTWLAVPAALFLAAVVLVFPFAGAGTPYRVALTGVAVASAVVVGAAYLSGQGRIARVLTAPWLRWVGVRSYGLYLWHYPVILVVTAADVVPFTLPKQVLEVALSVAMAAASYRWIEAPFLRRREPLGGGSGAGPSGAPPPPVAARRRHIATTSSATQTGGGPWAGMQRDGSTDPATPTGGAPTTRPPLPAGADALGR